MKNSILKTSIFILLIAVVCISCEKENDAPLDEQNQEIRPEPTADAAVQTEMTEVPVELAKIQKDGHEITFFALGDDDDLAVTGALYGENLDKAYAKLKEYQQMNDFELFISITNQSIAVPHRIAMTVDASTLDAAKRTVLPEGAEKVLIEDPGYTPFNNLKTGFDVGATNFQNNNCNFPLASNPNFIEFCDLGPFIGLTRSSFFGGNWEHVDSSYGEANNIGDTQRVDHQTWENTGGIFNPNWQWVLKFRHEFNGSIGWSRTFAGPKTERRIIYSRPTGTGSFRAYSLFED